MDHTGGKVSIVPGSSVDPEAIVAFGKAIYGPHAHQAKHAYYRWLYTENPGCPEGLGHMLVAVEEGGKVVGFVNRMVQTWTVNGRLCRIPAIGDLALADTHRRGGPGLRLVLASTRNADHAFVNGSNPNSSPLFRSLKYQELEGAAWCRSILSPVRAGLGHAGHRLFGRTRAMPDLSRARVPAPWKCLHAPDERLRARLAELLNDHPAAVRPHWTTESLTWRFFHPLGPRHLLVHDADMRSFVLLSAGVHRGVTVCRPIAYRHASPNDFLPLLKAAIAASRSVGADLFLAFTMDRAEAEVMRANGLQDRATTPGTFFFHRRRDEAAAFARAWVQGSASDLGLEAIP